MSSSLALRSMQESDLEQVVNIHLTAFKSFFLTFLGAGFLRELYSAILSDPAGFGYACVDDFNLQGFVVGTVQPSNFYRRLLIRRWWRFGLACIKPTLKNPKIIPRILRAFHKPYEVSQLRDCAILMSIAVRPEVQGYGIGKSLVQAFMSESSRRGIKYINLTTDNMGNDNANGFYINMGFRCVRTYVTPEGRKMNEYEISL